MRNLRCWLFLLGAAVTVRAGGAWSGDESHEGLLLHLGVGAGLLFMDFDLPEDTGDGSLQSRATLLEMRLGACVLSNFALTLDGAMQLFSDPEVTKSVAAYNPYTGRQPAREVTFSTQGDYRLALLGLGATWYFEEPNAYVGGSLYFWGQESYDVENRADQVGGSTWGYALRTGKEWWISSNWGLGGQIQYSRIQLDARTLVPETDTFGTFAVLLSATFN